MLGQSNRSAIILQISMPSMMPVLLPVYIILVIFERSNRGAQYDKIAFIAGYATPYCVKSLAFTQPF